MDNNIEWTKFLRGEIQILQPVKGARFSIDSIIVADFCHIVDGEEVLELGSGSGIILVLLDKFYNPMRLCGVEIQEKVANLSKISLEKNGVLNSEIINCDLKKFRAEKKFDVVLFNPPFYETKKSLLSPLEERRISRHQQEATLEDFLLCAKRNLKEGGRVAFIYPSGEEKNAIKTLKKCGFHPSILRFVFDNESSLPTRILILARLKESYPVEIPPLILKKNGEYTEEAKRFLGEKPFINELAFFCDAMVYRLAKYLRFCGLDSAYLSGANDDWLIERCSRNGRILLTLDRELSNRFKKINLKVFELKSFIPKEQFFEVKNCFNISEGNPKRCLKCNSQVFKIERDKVKNLVHEYTFLTHKDFYICKCCSKITWGGSHLIRFKKEILNF